MLPDIVQHLAQGHILIADGATGTMLQSLGLPVGIAPELWNVEQPDHVRSLYRAYMDAGSQIILTNTFGGSRIKLDRAGGLGERAVELNRAAAELARLEAETQAFVAGDIGPTGELMEPYGDLSYEEAVSAFAQQAGALAQGGVDVIWVETMSDLSEAQAAIEGAKQVTNLPILCSLSFTTSGRTMMGVRPGQAAQALWPLGLLAIGANCGEGLDVISPVLTEMRATLGTVPLIAKPNAGLPHLEDGQTVFDLGPTEFATRVSQFIQLGAQIIGGCCGSSPQHIAAIATAAQTR